MVIRYMDDERITGEQPAIEPLLTPEQVQDILNMTPRSVADLLRSGRIPTVRINRMRRVRPSDLQRFIEENLQS